jgi:hypothetical protein
MHEYEGENKYEAEEQLMRKVNARSESSLTRDSLLDADLIPENQTP